MEFRSSITSCNNPRTRFAGFLLTLVFVFVASGCSENSADDYIGDAVAFSQNNDPKAALVALKNAVQVAPRSAVGRFELGKVHLSLNNFLEATKELSLALEYGYPESDIIPLLAEALGRSGANVALAELEYQSSLLTQPEQLEVGARKIGAMLDLSKEDEASVLVDELLLININSPYKEMVKSYEMVIVKNNIQALGISIAALQRDPYNRDVMILAARLYILVDDIDNAINVYENYVQLAPEDSQTKFLLINLLMQQEQLTRAEKYIDELLSQNNTNGLLNQFKAITRAASNDHEAARNFAEKAINSGRGDYNLRLIAAFSGYKLSDFESVVKHVSAVANILPFDHPALRMLADSHLQLNMGSEAALVLSRVDSTAPDPLSLFSRTGYQLIREGDDESAQQMMLQSQSNGQTANDLVRLGAIKLSLKDMSGIGDLEAAVAKAPDSLNAKMALAGAYLASGDLDVALAFSKWWQNNRPLDVESHLLEADVLSTQENYVQAAQAVNAAAQIDASSTLVQLANIRLDIISENYTRGLSNVDALLTQEPYNVKALANYFKIQTELGNPERAFDKIKNAAQNDDKNEALTILFASTLMSNQQFTSALDVLSRIDADRLTLPTFWEIKGAALFNTENLVEGESHYRKWVNFFPNDAGPTLGLLSVLELQRNYTEAVKVATTYLANQDDFQVRMMAAHFFAASNDAKGAQGILDTIRPQYLDLPYLRGVKARIALLEGRGMQGVNDAEAAYFAQQSSDNLRIYARTLESAGQTQKVLPIIQNHMTDFPNDARSKALLAERTIASNPSQALRYYEELLNQFPNSPSLLNNAAYLHFQAGNLEKALEYSTDAFKSEPANTAFADTYAQILLQLGEAEKAVEAYSLVINDDLRDEEVILNYIEALLKNNNTLAAKRRIQQFTSSVKTQKAKQRLFNLQVEYLN